MIRLGNPSSDPTGCCIERTVKGQIHRYSLRAWHPLYKIPAIHFSREELAHFIGATIPERKQAARRRSFPAAKRGALA